jgi:hypothetical protein
VNEVDIKSGIVYYDAPFEIEPMDGVFRSRQRVTLAADQPKSNTLTIYLANILVIDHLATEYDQGKELPLRGWNKIASTFGESSHFLRSRSKPKASFLPEDIWL